MRKPLAAIVILAAAAGILPGCATAPGTATGKASLHSEVADALKTIKEQDPTLQSFLSRAYAYAIFPEVGKGAIGIGGAYGRGEVYDQGKLIGYCDLSQATLGVQLGGQSYIELIAFQNKDSLDRFKSGTLDFAAQASAVALRSGASADAKYAEGVAVFTAVNGGLMFEASIGGQRFSFQPL